MSIYLVRLSEWFPPGDEMYENAFGITKHSRCLACGNRMRYKKAIGHHSIPWGYGDIWCSWKCCESRKIAKEDKRRIRRMNRRYKGLVINVAI